MGRRVARRLLPDSTAPARATAALVIAAATVLLPATALGIGGLLCGSLLLLALGAATLAAGALPAPLPELPRLPRDLLGRLHAVAWALFVLSLGSSLWSQRSAPPGVNAYDDTSYHLAAVLTFRDFGDLRTIKFPVGDGSTSFYPLGSELWSFTLLAPLDPSDVVARWSELPFALGSLAAVAAVTLALGAPPSGASLAALLWGLTPRAFPSLARSAGNDHATAFFTLAAVLSALLLLARPGLRRAALLGLAAGLLLGTKMTGVLFVVPAAVLALALVRLAPRQAAPLFLLAGAVAAAAGGHAYLRNAIEAGNPLFPSPIRIPFLGALPGWPERAVARFRDYPYYPIEPWRFLWTRTDLLGAAFRFTLLPAALLAPGIALSRRAWRAAYVLSLPAALYLAFLYLMLDHRDVRYVFGGIALAAVAFAWLVSLAGSAALAFATLAAAAVLAGRLLAFAPGDLAGGALVALGAALALAAAAAPAPRVRCFAFAGLALLVAFPGASVVRGYEAHRLDREPLARELDGRTRDRGSVVACVGTNQPYLYAGTGLQNRVVYVPTFREPESRFYPGSGPSPFPRAIRIEREWRENVARMGVGYVVVRRTGMEEPEAGWIGRDASFENVFADASGELYAVRPLTGSRR